MINKNKEQNKRTNIYIYIIKASIELALRTLLCGTVFIISETSAYTLYRQILCLCIQSV